MRADAPVVWISHKDGERCAGCGKELESGRLIRITRAEGIRCLACSGLKDLVFLPAGDPALTRRAIALSSRHAVEVRFSRARKRHERQGVLVEEAAIERAKHACAEDASRREAARRGRRARSEMAEGDYVARFAAGILEMYLSCPRGEAEAIAHRACEKYSGRVGRTAAAKALDAKAVELAVRAHVRYRHTEYDRLLSEGADPRDARAMVRDDIGKVLEAWRRPPAAPPSRKPERPGERERDFHWRFAMYGNEVPPGVEESAASMYEEGKLDHAEAAFRLLVDAFDHYAEGYNFLGCIAYDRGNLPEAMEMYRKAASLGRNLFPKRIARSRYWSDLSTRPYMRGLQNLAMSLTAARQYDEALVVCDRLERECDDRITADSHRAAIHLNTGMWATAAEEAERLRGLHASESFVSAFARAELGQWREAMESFLHAALNHPGTARMLVGARNAKPRTSDEARDHNTGVGFLRSLAGYFGSRQGPRTRRFFRDLVRDPRMAKPLDEIETVRRRWFEERPADRALFDRMHEMQTLDFARQLAKELSDWYPAAPIATAGRH